ncbi:ComF family protein [Bacillus sp. NP157]|nr:ComF family protein [Bacillus sp. NP157]
MDAFPWLARLGRFVFPPRCLLCGAAGAGGIELCLGCTAALPLNSHACPRCALPRRPLSSSSCEACARRLPPWRSAWVPFRYAWPLDLLEARFKFGGNLVAGKVLAHRWIAAGPPPSLPDAIVPVPLHVARLRQRGFNQALELVKPVAKHFGVPLAPRLLRRVRMTEAQSDLDAEARATNVRGAFVARPGSLPTHVAVVDDVMTTGATLAACVEALHAAGVQRVDVWALARTLKS